MNRRDLLKTVPAAAAALQLPTAARAQAGKGRLRSAICCYAYRDALKAKTMTYEDVVHKAVEFGIDGLDTTVYWFPDTSDSFLYRFKREAYRCGVEIYSIAVATEMTKPTPELQEKELAGLKGWVDVAEKLGAGHVRVFGGRIPKGAAEEQAAGWVAEVLKRGADYAGRKGVILGLENHGGITEKADTILGILKKVDSPWVGVNLDTGNFNSNGYQQMEQCMPYAVNVQVKTEVHPGPRGSTEPSDWERICQLLVKNNYRGYLSLEYEAPEPVETAMPRLLKKLAELTRKYSV